MPPAGSSRPRALPGSLNRARAADDLDQSALRHHPSPELRVAADRLGCKHSTMTIMYSAAAPAVESTLTGASARRIEAQARRRAAAQNDGTHTACSYWYPQ